MLLNLMQKKKRSNRKPRTTLGARSYYFFSGGEARKKREEGEELLIKRTSTRFFPFPLSSRVTQKNVRSAPIMLVDGEYIVSIINSVHVNSA